MNEESMKQFRRIPQCVHCGAELLNEEAPCLPCRLKAALKGVDPDELQALADKIEATAVRYGWDKKW